MFCGPTGRSFGSVRGGDRNGRWPWTASGLLQDEEYFLVAFVAQEHGVPEAETLLQRSGLLWSVQDEGEGIAQDGKRRDHQRSAEDHPPAWNAVSLHGFIPASPAPSRGELHPP